MDRTQLAELLAHCMDEHGEPLSLEIVEKRSHKSCDELLEEENKTDVTIVRNDATGRYIINRMSGWLIIQDKRSQMEFRETGREFADGHILYDRKKHGIKETRRNLEEYKTSLIWGIWEELGILVDPDELFETLEQRAKNLHMIAIDHESTVYYGAITRVAAFEFTWYPFERSWFSLFCDLFRPHFLLKNENLRPVSLPMFVRERVLSTVSRFSFWLRFKKNAVTVIKERGGMKVYGRWFSKKELALEETIGTDTLIAKEELTELPQLFEKLRSP